MLEWLTFVAAAVAAAGAVLGPLITSRSSAARRLQEEVDHNVRFCLSDDPAIRRMGINQLAYLLDSKRLAPIQANAAAEAMRAALRKAGEQVAEHPAAEAREDPAVTDAPLAAEWNTGGDSDG